MSITKKIPSLYINIDIVDNGRKEIINFWVRDDDVAKVLTTHKIEITLFKEKYAYFILDYFINVVRGTKELGDCPVIAELLEYLKSKDISASELFVICTHFRKSMVEYLFSQDVMTKELFKDVSFVFDNNFRGVLELYETTIYKAQREAKEHKQLLEGYSSAIDESALVSKTDTQGIITYANDKFVEVSGYSRDELIGAGHNIIRHKDMSADFYKEMWHTLEKKEIFKGTIKNLKKDGEPYYVDATVLPLFDADGNVKEYLAVRYEVSELIQARDSAIYAEKSKDIFLANMSHEIRTPLNAILGFVDILRKKSQDEESKEYLGIIYNNGQTLLSIISDILDFAKLKNGKLEIENHNFDPVKEIGIVIGLFFATASEKEISYENVIDPSVPLEIIADSVRIKQIITNFLSNAFKFTSSHGKISLGIKVKSKNLIIAVKDNGVGMTPEQQESVFIPFEQAQKSTTRKYGGTGLGLAISLKLAKLMGGDIELKSVEGKGTVFKLIVPIEHTDSLQSSKKFDEKIDNITEDITLFGKILVAEDNRANQQLIRILLEDLGLKVDIANDGEEAVAMYSSTIILEQENRYSLILMDQQMPVLDGIGATHKIRALEKDNVYDTIPIIALTANALKGDREKFMAEGMNEYITKPINVRTLQKVLCSFLNGDLDTATVDKTKVTKNNEEKSMNIPDYSNLNVTTMAEEIGLKAKHIPILVGSYVEESKTILADLRSAIDKKDFSGIQHQAHSIKGSSGNLRFEALYEMAKEMELAAKENNSSFDYQGTYDAVEAGIATINV